MTSAPVRRTRTESSRLAALARTCATTLVVAWYCGGESAAAGVPVGSEALSTALPVAQAVRVERAPRLDGTLDDPLWQRVDPITSFYQREPHEGQSPTEKTEVRILYTRTAAYFGIRCFDSNPSGITATELRRDLSQELDDYFEIIIDPDHDRRNAHVFQINPLGTQRDGLITEELQNEGGDGDPGWDGIWTSEARIDGSGWTATVEIPFATLNLRQSQDVVWGINFKRFIRRKNEEILWAAWRRVDGASRISRAGELRGITDIGDGRLFVVKPYALAGYDYLAPDAAVVGLTPGGSALHTGGVDVKIGVGTSLVANLTANTDFADADVDIEQFNLTPYRLFYPEKRQFFLENTSVFSFPLGGENDNLFFSRAIGIDPSTGQEVPIGGGAKLTGPLGDYELGALAVGTRASGPSPYADFEVVRVKRALWEGSYIGAIAMDKQSGNTTDRFNEAEGLDTRLVFGDLKLQAFLAETRTPGVGSGQVDWGTKLKYESNRADLLWDHRRIGANFNPETGFLERQDCDCDYLDLNLKARPERFGLRQLEFENFIFNAPSTAGILQTREVQSTLRAEFESGAYTDNDVIDLNTQLLTQPFNIYKNVFIPVGEYHFLRHQIAFGTARDKRWIIRVRERFGRYYDGTLTSTKISTSYRASEHLYLSTDQEWDRFRLPVAGGRFSVLVGSLQASYSFSRFVSASALLQVDTANEHSFGSNLRLRWNYRPDSDLYVVYTAGQHFGNLTATNPPQYYEQRFAIKWTYSWQP